LTSGNELEELYCQVFENSTFCFQIDLCKKLYQKAIVTNDFMIVPGKNNISSSAADQHQFQQVNRQFELITVFTDFYLPKQNLPFL
jgi:hypothetical protein